LVERIEQNNIFARLDKEVSNMCADISSTACNQPLLLTHGASLTCEKAPHLKAACTTLLKCPKKSHLLLQKSLDDLIKAGFVTPSTNPFNSLTNKV
jgi:hypothetical protein